MVLLENSVVLIVDWNEKKDQRTRQRKRCLRRTKQVLSMSNGGHKDMFDSVIYSLMCWPVQAEWFCSWNQQRTRQIFGKVWMFIIF